MKIKKITNKYKKYKKDPKNVWANIEMDELRRKECLCLNCDRKNERIPYKSCGVANKLFHICTDSNMAMAITRCGYTNDKGKLMYKPIITYEPIKK